MVKNDPSDCLTTPTLTPSCGLDHFLTITKGILDGYIKKFVLCQECYNPETKLTVRKNGIIQTCQACGYKGIFIW